MNLIKFFNESCDFKNVVRGGLVYLYIVFIGFFFRV